MCFVAFNGTIRLPPRPFIIGVSSIIFDRILSLSNFKFFQMDNIYSVFCYVEVFAVVFVWINLLHYKDIRTTNFTILILTFLVPRLE